MKKAGFLRKIKRQGKLEAVELSGDISGSYKTKAKNCLKSAKILKDASLYENSVSESYYAMYNTLLSLLFMCGIKSENHTASIYLLGIVFGLDSEEKSIAFAKKERIDKQYYVTDEKTPDVHRKDAEEMIKRAEEFILSLRTFSSRLTTEGITKLRKKFIGIIS